MPYAIIKNKGRNSGYKVINKVSKKVHAYHMKTLNDAKNYIKLLYYFAHGKK